MSETERPVLIVDDNPEVRQVLEEMIRLEGFPVSSADSGLQGLLRIGRENPVCLVLDLKLQDVSGFEIQRVLRSDPEFVGLPILFVSGAYANEDWVRGQLGKGPIRFLPKPVVHEDLVSALRSLIR